ncbi:MAG: hypothetical protein K2X39_10300 [Silvanigrellaceae bacterium]|nr:hypothetical protein [Silvanigrellaceae bacterium]
MISFFILATLSSIVLYYYVLTPLFSKQSMQSLQKKNSESSFELEIRNLILRRNEILDKLILNDPQEQLNLCNPLFEELVNLCSLLEEKGFSWRPIEKTLVAGEDKGFHTPHFVIFIVSLLIGGQFTNQAWSEEDLHIPPPIIEEQSGYWVPSVNQYVFLPAQGKLHVYYVGMFTNIYHAKGTVLQFPFPAKIENLKILDLENAILLPSKEEKILIKYPLLDNINQIRAEFTLDAMLGNAHWQKGGLAKFQGIGLFIFPEYIEMTSQVPFEKTASNHSPYSFAQQLLLVGKADTEFPIFKVTKITPSRTPTYLLSLFALITAMSIAVFQIYTLMKKR